MAPRTTRPGLRALDPTTPIGHTSWGPILPIAGGRAGSRGVDILVGDDDGDDPDFDDDDDEGDEDDDDEDTRADERRRAQDRRDAARGWQRPKKGQRDDEDDDGEDDQSDDETADERPTRRTRGKRGSADDTEEWTPPTRDQWESVTAAVKRNNDENLKRRYVAKAMKRLGIEDEDGFRDFMISRGLDPDSGEHLGGYDGAQDDGPDDLFNQSGEPDGGRDDEREQDPRPTRADIIAERRRAEERGAARAASKYKDGMALFAAEAALREAGWNGRDLDLALRLVDLDGVEVDFDDHGRPVVYNIDEQVKRIKEDVPEWFRPRRAPRDDDTEGRAERSRRDRPARRAGGARAVDGGERGRSGGRPQTWLERADAQMMGRGRR